jgi:hypothetical protein
MSEATAQPLIREDAAVRVERGHAWLREHGALFGMDVARIDVARLDLTSPQLCPWSQADSVFEFGVIADRVRDALGIESFHEMFRWLYRHGVMGYQPSIFALADAGSWKASNEVYLADCEALRLEWVRALTAASVDGR